MTNTRSMVNPDPLAAKVPLWLPMGFIAVGLVAGLLLVSGFTVHLPEFTHIRLQPRLLAVVHWFTLAFGSAITLGTLYQMAPVILVTKLQSPRIGWLSLALFGPGAFIIAGSFHELYIPGLAAGATITLLGAALFAFNMWHTWRSSPEDSLTRRFMVPALLSFFLTLLIGFLIAASWRFGWRIAPRGVDLLGTHVFLGAGGWFTGIIIGVSYRLVGMFRLVHGHDEQDGYTIMKLLYAGVIVGAAAPFAAGVVRNFAGGSAGGLAALIGPWFNTIGLLLVAVSAIAYARDFRKLWQKSVRPPDVWMAQVPWAIGYFLVSVVGAGLLYVWVQVFGGRVDGAAGSQFVTGATLAIGTLFALGWVGTMIIALLHKIVPFLVWYHRFSDKVGREPVPLMKDMVDESRGFIGFLLYHSSIIAAAICLALGVPEAARAAIVMTVAAYALLASDLVAVLWDSTNWSRDKDSS